MKIATVASKFNETITENLVKGALKALKANDVKDVPVYWVPGAFELPLACKLLIEKFDALVAVGAVIKGETPHFDYVCRVAGLGIADLSSDCEKPIGFGVITANTVDQAVARSMDNENNFGYRAALASVEMLKLKKEVKNIEY